MKTHPMLFSGSIMTPTDFHSPLLPDDGERRSERGLLPMRDEAELFDASGEPLF